MKYPDIRQAVFLTRLNRFAAEIEIDGHTEICHGKHSGRCRELLTDRARVLVQEINPAGTEAAGRKTKYDLISVYKDSRLINMDSQAPNKVFAEWVSAGGLYRDLTLLRPETRYGTSRFDFYLEGDGRKAFVEVKGVTLEEEGVVRFPDAPTERGARHVRELVSCIGDGYDAWLVFIIQLNGVKYLEPNRRTDPAFAAALEEAGRNGVHILALDSVVTEDGITAGKPVPVRI